MPAAAAFSLALTSSGGSAAANVVEGGIFRLGTAGKITSLNPFNAVQTNDAKVYINVYPTLIQYDGSFNYVPDLATQWSRSSDGKTWTFVTHAGAHWSDGTPLTARDAAWTLSTIAKYKSTGAASFAANVDHLVRATAPSATKLVLKFDAPSATALFHLSYLPILPKHVWIAHTGHGGADLKRWAPENALPVVGGGAFVPTEYRKNDVLILTRNRFYYGPKPHVGAIGLRFYSNTDALVTALKNAEIDAIDVLPPNVAASLKRDGRFTVLAQPGLITDIMEINSNPKKLKHRELLKPEVRLALDLAIDRQALITLVFNGYARLADSLLPPRVGSWHNQSLSAPRFNLSKANRILDKLYPQRSGGIRLADGQKMSYVVIAPNDVPYIDRAFAIVQSGFRRIGVDVVLRKLDPGAAFAALGAPNSKYLTFDLAMWYWTAQPDPDFLLSVATCSSYGVWSDTGYCNTAYDRLYRTQATTLNVEKRRVIVSRMEEIIGADRPYLYFVYEDGLEAHSTAWAGFGPRVGGQSFNSFDKMFFPNVRRVKR